MLCFVLLVYDTTLSPFCQGLFENLKKIFSRFVGGSGKQTAQKSLFFDKRPRRGRTSWCDFLDATDMSIEKSTKNDRSARQKILLRMLFHKIFSRSLSEFLIYKSPYLRYNNYAVGKMPSGSLCCTLRVPFSAKCQSHDITCAEPARSVCNFVVLFFIDIHRF